MKKYIFIFILMAFKLHSALSQDGTVDTTYGVNGTVFLEHQFVNDEYISDIQKDINNRLLFLYAKYEYFDSLNMSIKTGSSNIMRFTEDGIIDRSFGTNGIVELPVGPNEYYNFFSCQPDNKIVLAGTFTADSVKDSDIEYCHTKIVMLRLLENGDADHSFGMQGQVFIDLDTILRGNNLAFQKDGKILLTGEIRSDTVNFNNNKNSYFISDLFLMRLDSKGSVDKSFGINGLVTRDIYKTFYDKEIGVQLFISNENNIIVDCSANNFNNNWGWPIYERILVCFDQYGSIVSNFGKEGISQILGLGFPTTGMPSLGQVLKNSDDSFLAAYYSGGDYWFPGFGCIRKITKNGIPDNILSNLCFYEINNSSFNNIEILPDERILVCGKQEIIDWTNDYPVVSEKNLLLMRLSSDGKPDIKFGNFGKCLWNPGSIVDEVGSFMIINSNDRYIKILGLNYNYNDNIPNYFITRINNYISSESNKITYSNHLNIIPNPTTTTFSLDLPEDFNYENAIMTVYDLYGRVVMEKKDLDLIESHDISGQPEGIYLINIHNREVKTVSRLIKM